MRYQPGSLIAWIMLGLLAGWIAGQLTRGRGFGCVGNVVVGLVGAVVGGFLFSALGFHGPAGFLGSLLIAAVGASVLIFLINLVTD